MLLRRKVPKVTSLRARPHARVRESAHLTDTVREPAIEERLIGWPAAIIYMTKHRDPDILAETGRRSLTISVRELANALHAALSESEDAEVMGGAEGRATLIDGRFDLICVASRVVRNLEGG